MTRINFEVDESQAKDIDELVDQTGLKTKVNLFNTALTLFEWAVRERLAGRAICSQDLYTGALKEIEMPGFPPLKSPANPLPLPVSDASVRITRAQFSEPGAGSVKNLPEARYAYLTQMVQWLSQNAETPQQAKEVIDLVHAFGAEIKPEAQERLSRIINHK